ncbi:MAG: hypothetical protein Q9175_007875, partial [Cornicularia normoerica]
GGNKAPHLRLSDDSNLPRVDVLITCAGEDLETVTHTTEAACAIDYESDRFRVIVSDDAGSNELGQAIQKLAEDKDNLFYTSRVKGKDHHFKAGNLNHCLEYTNSLSEGPAEFIAALDADMIADPQLLRALLPHMLKDSKLALAQTPQRFYDVPTADPLLQGLDVNFKITEPLKEMGSTWCGGSGYVIRRAAIEDIGGFPTESVGEDMYCSNVLLGRGWNAIYVDETLQSGRVPESYKAHVKQQGRWHVGRLQTAIAMRFYLYGKRAQRMGFRQRMIGLIYVTLSLCNILTTIGMGTLLVSISTGKKLVYCKDKIQLRRLVQLVCASVITEWLDDCVVALITGYRIAISEGHISLWIAPYHAATIIRAFLPAWIQTKPFEFTPSGSSADSKRETLPKHDIGRLRQAWNTLWGENVGLHLIYFLLCTFAVARSCSIVIHESQSLPLAIITSLAWPPVLWFICLDSFVVPIHSAFCPPSIPNRSQLLKRDPLRRASYPDEVREVEDGFIVLFSPSVIMAFNFNWSPLTADASFYTRAQELLTTALNKSPRPPIIVDDILVNELKLGSVPPDLEISKIGDLAEDRFWGIFKLFYIGDAFLTFETRV